MSEHLIIVSRGRPDRQKTFFSLSPYWRERVQIMIPASERSAYNAFVPLANLLGVPDEQLMQGISGKRQLVIETFGPKVVMMDDDLAFNWKVTGTIKQIKATDDQITAGIQWMFDTLSEQVPHVGLSVRSLNYDFTGEYIEVTRMMQAIGYYTPVVHGHGCKFNKNASSTFTMEDFHMTLQLLRRGLPNRVGHVLTINPDKPNLPGGVSLYRTQERHNASAEFLASQHPDFVKTVQRPPWPGFTEPRVDVRVQWRKAYLSGQRS